MKTLVYEQMTSHFKQ